VLFVRPKSQLVSICVLISELEHPISQGTAGRAARRARPRPRLICRALWLLGVIDISDRKTTPWPTRCPVPAIDGLGRSRNATPAHDPRPSTISASGSSSPSSTPLICPIRTVLSASTRQCGPARWMTPIVMEKDYSRIAGRPCRVRGPAAKICPSSAAGDRHRVSRHWTEGNDRFRTMPQPSSRMYGPGCCRRCHKPSGSQNRDSRHRRSVHQSPGRWSGNPG